MPGFIQYSTALFASAEMNSTYAAAGNQRKQVFLLVHLIVCHIVYCFSKLIERRVSHIVIRLLAYWYTSQTFVIGWNNILSDPFTVSNGVRQGSILSPTLFSIYLDSLSVKLSESGVGCTFNSKCFNHLVYADDTVLLAPSLKLCKVL